MIQKREINSMPSVLPQKLEAEPVATGVISFNGRTGVVRPQTGDYTAAMVGADPVGSAKKVKDDLTAEISNIPVGPEGPTGPEGPQGEQGPAGADGKDGSNGVTFTPSISEDGTLQFTNDGGLPNPEPVNVIGPQGEKGKQGATFFPSVNEAGIISWENDNGLQNPNPVDIKGPQGPVGESAKINGENAINIVEGDNININQDGTTLTISAISSGGQTLIAGPDMKIEENVINQKLPVRYKTAEEYAALSQEDKMLDVLYVVSDNPSPSEYKAEYVHQYEDGNFMCRVRPDNYCELVYQGSTQFNSGSGTDFLTMKKHSLETGTIELPFVLSNKYSETITYEIHKVSDGTVYALGDNWPISMENHIVNDSYMAEWSIVYTPPETAENIEVAYVVRITGIAQSEAGG